MVVMSTTIQVSDRTKKLLESLKGAKQTYDGVINELIEKKVPEVFGTLKGKGAWSKKDRLDLER